MNPTIGTILSLSNVIAGVIGIYRFRKINQAYYPFLIVVFLGIFNDVFSLFLVSQKLYTIVNNNIYVLLEALLICWFFKCVGLFKNRKIYFSLMLLILSVWTCETIIRDIHHLSIYYRIFYSFLVVLLSINMINKLLVYEKGTLLKNSAFIICIAFIIYFTLKALVNAFWLYGLTKSREFLLQIHIIMMYTNLFTNLLFALAALWIPKKQASILPY